MDGPLAPAVRTRRTTAGDGVSLVVWEHGDPAARTVLAVHGYPDDHTVWDGVVALLAEKFHVVTYDVRGAGESGAPAERAGYRLDQLADDLATVLDAVSPDRPVHLLAHDWGSIQAWHALYTERLAGRVASYTSISGPGLDHAGEWLRSRLRRPTPRRLRELATQVAASGYIGYFQLPALPEWAWRSRVGARMLRLVARGDAGLAAPKPADAVRGLALYRENMPSHLSGHAEGPDRARTTVPVQVLAPTRDPFVSTALQSDVARWSTEPRLRHIAGGHWVPRSRPDVIARCVTELAEHLAGGPDTRGLRRAAGRAAAAVSLRPNRHRHHGELVVITGAGGGMGRATALGFARRGADVVVADIDEASAAETARLVRDLGVRAGARRVDVADEPGMRAFAEAVLAEHGVPDVVVNNAGIGMAGAFADTTTADWRRVIDVNLWGVIHGCQVFSRPMVEQGEGGRIVNIASAAAYVPSRVLPAYATIKSAVLMLSECLRGELAEHGIGVVAVCPGLVHTNITATTTFVGADPAEQSRRQQATFAAYRRRNFTPERAAEQIIRAAERNTAVAPVTVEARVGLALSRLTPALLRAAARREISL
ncbi:MAG TPA: SDR family oxidoreductase [Pseudonocardia sp.]|jgi:NAD(P)-dependent dehydrogenase (short-subunit alcohol dehydrogenase family)/pimeloyl-ACP methyl ester carboxylesterase|uniref:SDR family oxidoreductase n=1 Tax=Pseudonocardia sp. TaxID=60912 RepID=UPI002F42AFB0